MRLLSNRPRPLLSKSGGMTKSFGKSRSLIPDRNPDRSSSRVGHCTDCWNGHSFLTHSDERRNQKWILPTLQQNFRIAVSGECPNLKRGVWVRMRNRSYPLSSSGESHAVCAFQESECDKAGEVFLWGQDALIHRADKVVVVQEESLQFVPHGRFKTE